MRTALYSVISVTVLGLIVGVLHLKTDIFLPLLERTDEPLASAYATQAEGMSVHVRLAMEAFDTIEEHYWQEVDESELAELYTLAAAKALEKNDVAIASRTRASVAEMLQGELDALETDERRQEVTLQTLNVVLFNLAPQGRNKLLTRQEETNLRNTVANRDPAKNLYDDLGVRDGASVEEVKQAYEEQRETLAASTSPEAKEKLARVERAGEVLQNEATKARYDESGVEPSVSYELIGSDVLYINISKITPTGVQEFVEDVNAATKDGTRPYLIIDLRGNVGGSLDFARYFLGIFLGPTQYVADLFSKGEREPMRTPEDIPRIEPLQQFTDIAILVDEKTQSTAELTAAVFRRLNLATIIGVTTKGWGSVENTFPLETQLTEEESYVLFLVHSLTLRDDQQPIEGNGVLPDVNVSEADWEDVLVRQIEAAPLRRAVVTIVTEE